MLTLLHAAQALALRAAALLVRSLGREWSALRSTHTPFFFEESCASRSKIV